MNEGILGLLVAVVSGGALSAFVVSMSNRAKTRAQTTDIISVSFERVIARLEAIIVRLENEKNEEERRADALDERLRKIRTEVDDLRSEVARLRRLLVTNGIDPATPTGSE